MLNRLDVLLRENWIIGKDESPDDYTKRIDENETLCKQYRDNHGLPIVVRYDANDYRVHFSKEINPSKLKIQVKSPFATPFDCPLCQPWEYERRRGAYRPNEDRMYMMRVVYPHRPTMSPLLKTWIVYDCFVEDGGNWKRCLCNPARR